MGGRGVIARLRERLVLSHMRALLDEGEKIMVWAHVHAPDDGRHGIVSLTPARCFVNWTARDLADIAMSWEKIIAWGLQPDAPGGPVLTLETREGAVAMRLPTSSKVRARNASAVLRAVAELASSEADGPEGLSREPDFEVRPEQRGLRGHTRRVLTTVIGGAVIVVGLLFASPFVPGPGILTILAGLAILASEYDWAKDAHHWLRRKADELWERLRARRQRRRAARRTGARR